MKTKDKKVSNLELKICKLRDILEKHDNDLIFKNLYLMRNVDFEVRKQLNKYIQDADHKLDFGYEDIKVLADEAFIACENLQQKFLFSKYHKTLTKDLPITSEAFNKFSIELGNELRLDTDLREFYKDMGYTALVIWLWSHSEDKMTFEESLLNTMRSLLQ